MSLSTHTEQASSVSEAAAVLADEIRAVFEAPGFERGETVTRLSVRIPDTDPLRWLRSQTDQRRLYWSGRDDGLELAGSGVADEIVENLPVDYPSILNRLKRVEEHGDQRQEAGNHPRYVGGIRFDTSQALDETLSDAFRGSRLVLPLIEMRRDNGSTELSCHLRHTSEARDRLLAALASVRQPERSEPTLPESVGDWRCKPDREGWDEIVRRTMTAIEDRTLEKAVLSRRCRRHFAQHPDPYALLELMRPHSADCFHFAFQIGPTTFVAASPERLYRRNGTEIVSEALAGTRPRGRDQMTDARYGEELLESIKDIEEHRFVSEHIRQALRHLCARPDADGMPHVVLRKLTLVQHLMTSFRGELAPGVTDADILAALHPTPAVAGTPTVQAMELIRRLEGYDRGWYAGPVGWLGDDGAEFAVGIRSCLIEGNLLTAFAGAGIVAGSTPESEWHETAAKLAGYQGLF